MKFIQFAYDRQSTDMLDFAMSGKFDPTDKEQLAIAERIFGPSGIPENFDFDAYELTMSARN